MNQNPKIKSLTLKSQGSKSGSTNTLVKKCRSTLHVSIKNRRNTIEEDSPESLDERDPQRTNDIRVILVKTTWFVPYKRFGKGWFHLKSCNKNCVCNPPSQNFQIFLPVIHFSMSGQKCKISVKYSLYFLIHGSSKITPVEPCLVGKNSIPP